MVFVRCINRDNNGSDPRGKKFAGSVSCKKCHGSVYASYEMTAHHNTTRPALKQNIHGSFREGQNTFFYGTLSKIVTEKRDSGLMQVLYTNGKEKEAHRFDIAFGDKEAQTFLYWKGNQTFELPISYYTSINGWATSPGFSKEKADFGRFIGKNCFECHSSYLESKIESTSVGMEDFFDKNSLVYGIDCERCHGPAANHVSYHLDNPDVKEAKHIVLYKNLNRQQQLDACAVCHSGNDKESGVSIFKFKMRDTLANFFLPSVGHSYKRNDDIDVHGSQYQLLAGSKCFIGSKTMTCTTCHDPHTNAGSGLQNYSAKCISCHPASHEAGIGNISFNEIKTNCIDCHMPETPSKAITFYTSGNLKKSAYLLRTHKIAVYKKADKEMNALLNFYKKNKSA